MYIIPVIVRVKMNVRESTRGILEKHVTSTTVFHGQEEEINNTSRALYRYYSKNTHALIRARNTPLTPYITSKTDTEIIAD